MVEYTDLISIVVPIYGTEAYLPMCIKSICSQTYSNLQIILVDDQSPDGCPEICDVYAKKDSRIIVIHQKNTGVSGARNTGIRYAVGKYIMFVDSDDELHPNAVELLCCEAKRYDADIVSGAMQQTREWVEINLYCEKEDRMIFRNDESILLSLKGDSYTESACAKLFKSDIIRDIWFEEGKKIHEDGFFLFQCYMKKPVLVHLEEAIYLYNSREGSASRQIFSEKYLSMLYFCERKKEVISFEYPQYLEHVYNTEVRTNLQLLDVLCSTNNREYLNLQKQCEQTVRELYPYHKPIHSHYKILSLIVRSHLYPFYKILVRLKYYRNSQS